MGVLTEEPLAQRSRLGCTANLGGVVLQRQVLRVRLPVALLHGGGDVAPPRADPRLVADGLEHRGWAAGPAISVCFFRLGQLMPTYPGLPHLTLDLL